MSNRLAILAALFLPLAAFGQTLGEKGLGYFPDGTDIVCINGKNMYTRALYGGTSGFRVETGDMPAFATYGGVAGPYNIIFLISAEGTTLRADSVEWCESRYGPGIRSYILRDDKWGEGEISISVLCDYESEAVLWRVGEKGFSVAPSIRMEVRNTSARKMPRNGDMGSFEKKGAYEGIGEPITCLDEILENEAFISMEPKGDGNPFAEIGSNSKQRFLRADSLRRQLTGSVVIKTPDESLNTLGGIMVAAADGAWDGETWLHGAVGWRSQLPGWRGAYMGDFLGMPDRQLSHFCAYAKSQVTEVPVSKGHIMDEENNLARGAYEWGTPMYSNGYICRQPGNNTKFHHYDMNLVYIDALLWHIQFGTDTNFIRKMWPVIEEHLAWEKQAWDPDGDHLYDAYCCIWASDALQYSSGAATHSSAYNYRANKLAARIAELLGIDPSPYEREAADILDAINQNLWTDSGHWAEYRDFLGNKSLHEAAALWSIYTPIDCGACSDSQAWKAMEYVDREIPKIPFTANGEEFMTLSTSTWQPYEWSINNVAMAEIMHTALAYYEAGRPKTATGLLKSCVADFMFSGRSPGNFGQLSKFDKATGEGYRDFADVTGISSRTILQGLFGITPQALYGECIIRPGFPEEWESVSVETPYIYYTYTREGDYDVYRIKQTFSKPLKIILRQNIGEGKYRDIEGTDDNEQEIRTLHISFDEPVMMIPVEKEAKGTALDSIIPDKCRTICLESYFNSSVTDIFTNEYLSPRSPYTTLCLPKQGIGDWCSTKRTANIDDKALREAEGEIILTEIPFATPSQGNNVVFASKWDNYPDTIKIPVSGKASRAYMLMAGSTNPMQSQFDNGKIVAEYYDGSTETLILRNPDNWCPIEQDYQDDGLAYNLPKPLPIRVALKDGTTSRSLSKALNIRRRGGQSDLPSDKKPSLGIVGGAGQILEIKLDGEKPLRSITITALANDVVIGLLALTLQE